jgi:hypothetical protein
VRSNGLPRGHIDLNRGHPSLSKNCFEGLLIIEVSLTSFSPEVIQGKATEYVKWLPGVCEAASVVGEEPGGVVRSLDDRLSQQCKRPGDC